MRYDAVQFLKSLFRPASDACDVSEPADDVRSPGQSPADLPADWHAVWDERAAIMEFDGGLTRELAEHYALLEVLEQIRTAN